MISNLTLEAIVMAKTLSRVVDLFWHSRDSGLRWRQFAVLPTEDDMIMEVVVRDESYNISEMGDGWGQSPRNRIGHWEREILVCYILRGSLGSVQIQNALEGPNHNTPTVPYLESYDPIYTPHFTLYWDEQIPVEQETALPRDLWESKWEYEKCIQNSE
jgi:hypothetical protein